MVRRVLKTLTACTAIGACAFAWAGDPPFEVVDPGRDDVSGASFQMRMFPVDLSPNGFLQTYRVPGRNDLLMRTNGALYAVFDEALYKPDPKVKHTILLRRKIPANTTFYIGRPDFKTIRSTGIRAVNLRRDDNHLKAPLRASTALESIGGVEKVKSEFLGTKAEQGPKMRRDYRLDLRVPDVYPVVSEDFSYKPLPPLDPTKMPHPPATAGAAQESESPARPERPQLGDRMNQLMRRASKDS